MGKKKLSGALIQPEGDTANLEEDGGTNWTKSTTSVTLAIDRTVSNGERGLYPAVG